MQDGGDELDFLGHALAQVGHFPVPPPLHFKALEPLFQVTLGLWPSHASERREVQDLLGHPHALVQAALLWEVPHSGEQATVVRLAPHAERATVRLGDARDHAQERGLACAVGAQEAHDFAGLHVQVQRRQGDVVAKRFGDALGVEDGLAHGQENMSRTLSKKPRSPWSGSGWKFAESRSSSNAFVSDLLNFLGVHTFKLISRSPLP